MKQPPRINRGSKNIPNDVDNWRGVYILLIPQAFQLPSQRALVFALAKVFHLFWDIFCCALAANSVELVDP